MRLFAPLAVAGLLLLGLTANAQTTEPLTLTFSGLSDPSVLTPLDPPDYQYFMGIIGNTTTSPVTIFGSSFGFEPLDPAGFNPANDGTGTVRDYFIGFDADTFNLSVVDPVAGFTIPAGPGDGFQQEPFIGLRTADLAGFNGFFVYQLTGEDPGTGGPLPILATGRIQLGGVVVPEPGTVALLVGGLVGGGLVARRRRK